MPALTSDTVNGFAVTIDVNLDGHHRHKLVIGNQGRTGNGWAQFPSQAVLLWSD